MTSGKDKPISDQHAGTRVIVTRDDFSAQLDAIGSERRLNRAALSFAALASFGHGQAAARCHHARARRGRHRASRSDVK